MPSRHGHEHTNPFAVQSRHRQRRSQRRDGSDHVQLRGAAGGVWCCCALCYCEFVCYTTGRADVDRRDYGDLFFGGCRSCWGWVWVFHSWLRNRGQQHVHLHRRAKGRYKCRRSSIWVRQYQFCKRRRRHFRLHICWNGGVLIRCSAYSGACCRRRRRSGYGFTDKRNEWRCRH